MRDPVVYRLDPVRPFFDRGCADIYMVEFFFQAATLFFPSPIDGAVRHSHQVVRGLDRLHVTAGALVGQLGLATSGDEDHRYNQLEARFGSAPFTFESMQNSRTNS